MKLHAVPKPLPAAPPPPLRAVEPPPPSPSNPLAIEVVDVTPELAGKWLERNHEGNRPINWRNVEAFANDMRSGAWRLTHQGICFDAHDRLIDGQHRLHAVVQSGATVKMLVIRNAGGDFHDPIDRVRPRSVGTILGMGNKDAACLNMLRMLEAGFPLHTPMTVNDAEEAHERHTESLTVLSTIPGRSKLKGPVLAALVWAMPVDRELAIDFAVKVASGEMISKGHPAYAFRSWSERNRGARSWDIVLASLTCLRFHFTHMKLAYVSTGEMGLRAFCAKRRALKIPNTPGADIVPACGWTPSKGEDRGEGK